MAHGRARPLVMCRNWAIRSGRYQPTHSSLALGRLLQWQDDLANGDISAIRSWLAAKSLPPAGPGHGFAGIACRSVALLCGPWTGRGASNRAKADFGIARRGCVPQN